MLGRTTTKAGLFALVLVALTATTVGAAPFKEYPAGDPVIENKMLIAAVYLQPITMEPRGMGLPTSKADVHLEADIHATRKNPNGFGAGEWIPYLTVSYELKNVDTGKEKSGTFMPMIAKDGPHYGANIKMMGPGNYELSYTIEPPSRQGFGRHTDEATGVGKWFKPFTVEFEFKYVPVEKG